MRYLILCFFTICQFNAIGQDAKENMKQLAFENPFHSTSQQYLTISNYTNYAFEDFLKFDWSSAEVKSKEDEVVVLDSVNFFLPDQKVIFMKNGMLLELFPDRIEKVKIQDALFQPFLKDTDNERLQVFFEVVAGTKFKILKNTTVKEEAKRVHAMGMRSSETKLVKRDRYYYVPEGTNFAIPIPGSKAKFLKTFRKHRKKMIRFLEKRKLSHRKEIDLIIIARYYNMLISEKEN